MYLFSFSVFPSHPYALTISFYFLNILIVVSGGRLTYRQLINKNITRLPIPTPCHMRKTNKQKTKLISNIRKGRVLYFVEKVLWPSFHTNVSHLEKTTDNLKLKFRKALRCHRVLQSHICLNLDVFPASHIKFSLNIKH